MKVNQLIVGIAFLLGLSLAFPARGAADEVVRFRTSDGYLITGTLSGNPGSGRKMGVVLLHMYKNNRQSWQPLVRELDRQGFLSLAIDLRGHGDSRISPTGRDDSARVNNRDIVFFSQMYRDAEAAVRFLVDRQGVDPDKIGMIGASVGCSVLFDAVGRRTFRIRAAVVMTPGRDYLGIPTMAHIMKWPDVPLLILCSKEELYRGAADIFRKLRKRGAALRVYDKKNIHGTNMFGKVEGIDKMIAAWLEEKTQMK